MNSKLHIWKKSTPWWNSYPLKQTWVRNHCGFIKPLGSRISVFPVSQKNKQQTYWILWSQENNRHEQACFGKIKVTIKLIAAIFWSFYLFFSKFTFHWHFYPLKHYSVQSLWVLNFSNSQLYSNMFCFPFTEAKHNSKLTFLVLVFFPCSSSSLVVTLDQVHMKSSNMQKYEATLPRHIQTHKLLYFF